MEDVYYSHINIYCQANRLVWCN